MTTQAPSFTTPRPHQAVGLSLVKEVALVARQLKDRHSPAARFAQQAAGSCVSTAMPLPLSHPFLSTLRPAPSLVTKKALLDPSNLSAYSLLGNAEQLACPIH